MAIESLQQLRSTLNGSSQSYNAPNAMENNDNDDHPLQKIRDKLAGKSISYDSDKDRNKEEHPLINALSKIPGYAVNAAENLPGALSDLVSDQSPKTYMKVKYDPYNAARDLAGGLARGSQNLAASGLELGEYLTRKAAEKLSGNKIPYWNAREFMGMEGKNPIDLGKMIESDNPDQLLSTVGQYGPGSASLGSKLLPLLVANSLTGAAQANPGDRLKAATEGAVNATLPALLLKGGIKTVQKVPKINEYMHPERASEKFRSTLGEGNSIDTVKRLSNRVQFANKSEKAESLIPKDEFYEKHGKSQVYNIDKGSLPEGNIEKLGSMMNDGDKVSFAQARDLSKALKDYRKEPKFNIQGKQTNIGGNTEEFLNKSEDVLNIPEIPDKTALKIEDILSMPTKRDSSYFSYKNVEKPYSNEGKAQELHNKYEKNSDLGNYDKLQSAIKFEQRKLNKQDRMGTISDTGRVKLQQLNKNIENLDKDKEKYVKTLPENMQHLENDFRDKYRKFSEKYLHNDSENRSNPAFRKLAKGKWSELTDNQIIKAFTHPTELGKKILEDIGPSAGRDILYLALQKVPPGDAAGLANEILKLDRTKRFSPFITPEIKNWANNMIKHTERVENIKKVIGSAGGLAAGSAVFGPIGGAIGASAPWALKGGKYLASKLLK